MRLTLLFFCVLLIAGGASAQNTVTDLSELAPIVGCWEQRDDGNKLLAFEQWAEPDGRSIRGKSRTFENGRANDWETMRIEQRKDGIFFVAKPTEAVEETSFKLVRSYRSQVLFENMQRDFPKRITYDFSPVELTSRIEGTTNGKWITIDLPMKRVKCEISNNVQ
jgi:hypothetical protein